MAVAVFIPSAVPEMEAWQAELDGRGFDIVFSSRISTETHSGFVPCAYRGEAVGFEYHCDPLQEYLVDTDEGYPSEELQRMQGHRLVVELITHTGIEDYICALLAAAAMCVMCSGELLECASGELVSHGEVVEWVRAKEASILSAQ